MREQRDASHAHGQPEIAVYGDQVADEVAAVNGSIGFRVTPEALDARVVASGAQECLRMAVDDRSIGAPQAVPDEQVVGGVRIGLSSLLGPGPSGGEEVAHQFGVEGKRVVLVEDKDGVMRLRGRGVGAGDHQRASHPAVHVGRGARLGCTEGITRRRADL